MNLHRVRRAGSCALALGNLSPSPESSTTAAAYAVPRGACSLRSQSSSAAARSWGGTGLSSISMGCTAEHFARNKTTGWPFWVRLKGHLTHPYQQPRADTPASASKQGKHVVLPLQGALLPSSRLWLWVFPTQTCWRIWECYSDIFFPIFSPPFSSLRCFLNPHKTLSICVSCGKELCG